MISEVLQRAWQFIVRGQFAYAGLSIEAYRKFKHKHSEAGMSEMAFAIDQGDYLRVGDIVKHIILPMYQGDKDISLKNIVPPS